MPGWINNADDRVYRQWRAAMNAAPITRSLRIIRETDKAVLVETAENPRGQAWLPKSQVTIAEPVNGIVDVTMPHWLAAKSREQMETKC